MKEKYDKYLPLGSVVLLKKARKRLMIIGYAIRTEETSNKMWDYLGCLYPEGVYSPDKNLVFDHGDIQEVYYMGYNDDEQIRYHRYIKDKINSLGTIERIFEEDSKNETA